MTSSKRTPSHFGFNVGTQDPAAPNAAREDFLEERGREGHDGREEAESTRSASANQRAHRLTTVQLEGAELGARSR